MTAVGFFRACWVGGSPEVVGAKAEVLEKPAVTGTFYRTLTTHWTMQRKISGTSAEWRKAVLALTLPVAAVMHGQVGCCFAKWSTQQLNPLITQAWRQLPQPSPQSHRDCKYNSARACDGATNSLLYSGPRGFEELRFISKNSLLFCCLGEHSQAVSRSRQ